LSFPRFLLFFCLFTIILGLIAYGIESITPQTVLIPKFWVVFGAQAGITLAAYAASDAGIKKGGELSVFAILGAITIKLLFAMGLALVYLLKIKANSTFFALQFFSLYFLFTVFEVICLLRNLRLQNKT